MTRALLHMHYTCTGAYRHTRTKPCAVSFEQSVVPDARALLHAAPCQCQCGSRNRLSGIAQGGKCSVRTTRTLLHMHRHIQTHTHTPWAVSFRLWGWTQGRCGRRHRVSVSAAAGTGSHAQRKQANAACACHKPVVWPWVVCMDRCHLSTARMQVNDKQCTRTMETGRARPRLVSIHDRD
jgi:hypothetical protein